MWALLVLALAVSVGASETNNDTAVEEKPVIARAKLMVSGGRNPSNVGSFGKFTACSGCLRRLNDAWVR